MQRVTVWKRWMVSTGGDPWVTGLKDALRELRRGGEGDFLSTYGLPLAQHVSVWKLAKGYEVRYRGMVLGPFRGVVEAGKAAAEYATG